MTTSESRAAANASPNPESHPVAIIATAESTPPTQAPSLLPDDDSDTVGRAGPPPLTDRRSSDAPLPLPSLYLEPTPDTDRPLDPPIDSHEQAMQRLIGGAVPHDELSPLIGTIFSGRKTHIVDQLRGSDVQTFVDVIDEALDTLNLQSSIRKRCVRSLYKTCAHHALIPRSLRIELSDDSVGVVLYRGGFGDVSKREYQGREVAVKTLRTYVTSDVQKLTRGFCKEFVSWKALRHPNVLPLLGVIMTETEFSMVSEWMPNGNINQFVKENWDANRFGLLADVAKGLIYMHSQGMVHGDLKGANILVDEACHARLADFGLLTIIPDSTTLNSCAHGGTFRWMSPELFNSEAGDQRPTKSSDCYALGMVVYEVLSGHVPFYQYKGWAISSKVSKGDRPERPQGVEGTWFTDAVWSALECCWTPQPENRPSIEDVLQCLEKVSRSWIPPPPQLLTVSSSAGSLTRGSSETTTTESTGGNRVSSPSQQLENLELIVDRAPHHGEGQSPHASNPLSRQGPPREAINGDDTGTNDLGAGDDRGDTSPEPTAQSSMDSTAGGNNSPTTDDASTGLKATTDDTPQVARRPPQRNSNPDATPIHHQDVPGMGDAPALFAEVGSHTEEDAHGWRMVHRSIRPVPVAMTTRAVSASISLIKVVNWDGRSQDIYLVLTTAFEAEDYLDCIRNLRERNIDPVSYINNLDKIIDSLPTDSGLRKRCIRALRKTCGLNGILPTSYTVSFVDKPGKRQRPYASGGFADVWKLADKTNQDVVFAVKSLRVFEVDPVEKIYKKYCKEVIVSKLMKHPNVLSIEGVVPELFECSMVSQWMPNGNLRGYVTKYPGANRLDLLIGVVRGLSYLHDNEVVHGNLKGPKIIIDADGNPRLRDFGLCSITENIDSVNASTPNHGCTVRYCAPELLDVDGVMRPDKRKPTTKSDMYSLSMVIVELATGKMPFPDMTDPNVTIAISKIKRPSKPRRFDAPGMTPAVWKVAQRCWHQKAKERPKANTVLQSLERLANPDDKPRFLQQLRQVFDG